MLPLSFAARRKLVIYDPSTRGRRGPIWWVNLPSLEAPHEPMWLSIASTRRSAFNLLRAWLRSERVRTYI
jgi:hypothetical protein